MLLLLLLQICNWLNCFQSMNEVIFSSPPPIIGQKEMKWGKMNVNRIRLVSILINISEIASTCLHSAQCALYTQLHFNTIDCRTARRLIIYLFIYGWWYISYRKKVESDRESGTACIDIVQEEIYSFRSILHAFFLAKHLLFTCFLFDRVDAQS